MKFPILRHAIQKFNALITGPQIRVASLGQYVRKKGKPRPWFTYRWARRNMGHHPYTDRQRRDLIRAGKLWGSR